MLGYNFIQEFLSNIFSSRGRTFDVQAHNVWIREVINLGADMGMVLKAEQDFMEDETLKLEIPIIKKLILSKKEVKLLEAKEACDWCRGTGLITITARFDNDGKYMPSQDIALRCRCKNAKSKNILPLNFETRNCKTKLNRGGYVLAWKNILERASYLKRVKENGGYDFIK